ncbi:MAG: DUF3048 domain-containing protein [Anaerolineae bacterium]|nr:DUF3048 domain-containing protein [Anaerolineae bacterium]
MPQLAHRARYSILFLLAVTLLVATACAGEETPVPPTPTSEVEVVVFSTEEPTATSTGSPSGPATPTATITVKPDANNPIGEKATPETGPVSGPAEFGLSRNPDISPLTGLKVDDQALIHRRPIMVRIGNDYEARPQVGLNEADIVYEELVEWWVTRFTAIYLSQDLETIAPIRSVRLINLQLAPQYRGALAHSGGSDPVRFRLSKTNITDLDEYFTPSLYFYRETENWATRLAFDATLAREYLLDEGLESDVNLRGFVFDPQPIWDDLPEEAVADAAEVTIPYPPQTSEAMWTYDENSGRYLRSTTGEPIEDFNGSRISAANVIIYFAEHEETDIVEDANGATSVDIIVNGFGTAWLLRDGKILKGNWQTDGATTPDFIFNNNEPMPLKPGNTWVEVVPLYYEIEIDGEFHARLGDEDPGALEPALIETQTPTVEPTPTLTPTPIGARSAPTPEEEPTPASD